MAHYLDGLLSWKCITLANNFIFVAFLKLHYKEMKGMFAHYLGYYTNNLWSHTLCLAGTGDSCNVNSIWAETSVWTEEACLSTQAVQQHVPLHLWLLPEVDTIKISLRYAYLGCTFLDVNLKFPKALEWVKTEYYETAGEI